MDRKDFHLRPISYEDLRTVLAWRNSNRVKSFMYTNHEISWEEHVNWFQELKSDSSRQVLLLFKKEQPLGLVNFTKIDKENQRCYWGFYIGDETAPKGAGTIMGLLSLDKMFTEFGLNKVCSEVIHTNTTSIRYHEKMGFVQEGRFVNHIRKDNHYFDVIPMALFSEKWSEVRSKL